MWKKLKISGVGFYSLINFGILVSLVFVLFGSVNHLAYTFNTIEGSAAGFTGWVIALGVESGLLWIAFGMSEKRKVRDRERMWLLTFFMFCFCFINFAGNYYYGIARYVEKDHLLMVDFIKVDLMIHFKTLLLSGSLPLIALALIEVYSIFSHKKNLEVKRVRREKKAANKGSAKPKKKTVDDVPDVKPDYKKKGRQTLQELENDLRQS